MLFLFVRFQREREMGTRSKKWNIDVDQRGQRPLHCTVGLFGNTRELGNYYKAFMGHTLWKKLHLEGFVDKLLEHAPQDSVKKDHFYQKM